MSVIPMPDRPDFGDDFDDVPVVFRGEVKPILVVLSTAGDAAVGTGDDTVGGPAGAEDT
jgi:hypothetical protein